MCDLWHLCSFGDKSIFHCSFPPPPRTHSRGGKNSLPVTSHSSVISDPSHTPPPAGHQHSPGQLLGEGQPLRFLLIFPSSPPTPPLAVQGAPLALAERLKVGVGLIEKHELLRRRRRGCQLRNFKLLSPATFCAHGWQLFFFLLFNIPAAYLASQVLGSLSPDPSPSSHHGAKGVLPNVKRTIGTSTPKRRPKAAKGSFRLCGVSLRGFSPPAV